MQCDGGRYGAGGQMDGCGTARRLEMGWIRRTLCAFRIFLRLPLSRTALCVVSRCGNETAKATRGPRDIWKGRGRERGGIRVAMLPLPSALLLLFHVGSFQFIKRSLPQPLTADGAWTRARNSAAVKDQGGVSYILVTCQHFRVDPGRIGRTAAFFSRWRRGEMAGLAG